MSEPTTKARKVLLDSAYALTMQKADGGYDVSYPDGTSQRWRIHDGGDESRVVEEESGEEMFAPPYAAHTAVAMIVQVNAERLKYDPRYIFYLDERGVERDGLEDIVFLAEEHHEKHEALTDVLEESLVKPFYKYLRKLAELKGVEAGFDLCNTIIQGKGA